MKNWLGTTQAGGRLRVQRIKIIEESTRAAGIAFAPPSQKFLILPLKKATFR
jgi:hypothetical protein